jgi:hypothetical protein
VKKAAPAKKATAKKAQPAAELTDEEKEVRDMQVAECAYCHNNIPIKVSGDGKVRYLMIHSGGGKPECSGSRALVNENGEVI